MLRDQHFQTFNPAHLYGTVLLNAFYLQAMYLPFVFLIQPSADVRSTDCMKSFQGRFKFYIWKPPFQYRGLVAYNNKISIVRIFDLFVLISTIENRTLYMFYLW